MLSEVPEGWEACRLADVAQINIGGTPSRSNEAFWDKTGKGEAWVSIADLKQRIVKNTKETITSLGVEKSNVKFVPEGTILMSFKLTVGRVALAGRDLYTNEAIAAFALSDGVVRDYLYHYLPTFVGMVETEQAVKGKTLNKKSLAEIPVFLPPLNEQHRIAEILSSVDASIQATLAVIEQAERVKRGLMEELLTGGLGSEAIERGEVPEGWTITKLTDLTTKIGSGVTPKGGKKAYVESGFQLIRSQNVGWGEMLLDDVAFITPEQHEKMDGTKLKKGDVLLNITGASIGRSAVYGGETGEANVNQHVCILRTREVLAAGYLNAWLLSHAGQKTIDAFQAGGNRQGLNFQQIGSFPIPFPPLSEQQRIAQIISSVDELIAQQKSVIEQQARTKRGLMDDLLTGKVRTV